jgi:hypothetical protein
MVPFMGARGETPRIREQKIEFVPGRGSGREPVRGARIFSQAREVLWGGEENDGGMAGMR